MLVFSKLWKHFIQRLSPVPSLTKTEITKYTDFNLADPPMEELFLVEDDILVGATGTFADDTQRIQPSDPSLLPRGYKSILKFF
jgi:hypothetical protein